MSALHLAARLFNPERLTVAREFRGLTKTALASKIGKTPSALTQFEAGIVRPDPTTLRKLSLALGFPVDFFGHGGRNLVIPLDACSFRSLRSASQRDRRRLLATASLVCELVAFLDQHVDFPQERVSELAALAGPDIEACSVAVRHTWGLGLGPIPNVIKLLEYNGIIVVPVRAGCTTVDAFSFWYQGRPVIMLVLDKEAPSRSRFDGIHELGHFVLHSDVTPGDPALEREADRFASAFLLPANSFSREAPTRLDWKLIMELKQRWRVSQAAIVRRSRDLGRISDASYRRAFVHLSASGQRRAERGEPRRETPCLITRALDAISSQWPIPRISDELGFSVDQLLQDVFLFDDTKP